ncbi:uncharacterized protein BO97DRAFT_244883 [Aspergillus homomorphus CBS 101889]|uniref:Uncharacterized protein n=1 Tax=Aspergillus homomorphus (strain CBS 101889) TaxID=1450537 RepID=A0A395HIB7_ASPHC|nr:hypothetical protein BO97DRAFT_244883 [Aspergillus homomorphus CBS 101889]RAL07651.1 hypothetical protein BO97DRAFT_244883 [Aspergillus homomorphus CBS 101889]
MLRLDTLGLILVSGATRGKALASTHTLLRSPHQPLSSSLPIGLGASDVDMLNGAHGRAVQVALYIIHPMAQSLGIIDRFGVKRANIENILMDRWFCRAPTGFFRMMRSHPKHRRKRIPEGSQAIIYERAIPSPDQVRGERASYELS